MTLSDSTKADMDVQSARVILNDFEHESVADKHGSLKHAIEELENARRKLNR